MDSGTKSTTIGFPSTFYNTYVFEISPKKPYNVFLMDCNVMCTPSSLFIFPLFPHAWL
jgi:hypothetical protein